MGARVLVTAVGAPPGTNTVRALRRVDGLEVIGADADPYAASLYLYAERAVRLPMARDEAGYVKALAHLVRASSIDIVIPCLEPEVAAIARHWKTLAETGVRFLIPSIEVLEDTLSKSRLAERAAALGITVPRTWRLTSDWCPEREGLGFPLVVKPDVGYGMRGVRIIRSRAEWDSVRSGLPVDASWIAQEFIPGAVGTVHMFGILCDRHSRPLGTFLSRSLRTQFDDGGPATLGEPVLNPEITSYGRRLAEGIGWVGPAGIEFKVDERTGRAFLLELNPRMWGYSWLATECGINLPAMLVNYLLARPVQERHEYPIDRVFIRGYQDVVIERSRLAGDRL